MQQKGKLIYNEQKNLSKPTQKEQIAELANKVLKSYYNPIPHIEQCKRLKNARSYERHLKNTNEILMKITMSDETCAKWN